MFDPQPDYSKKLHCTLGFIIPFSTFFRAPYPFTDPASLGHVPAGVGAQELPGEGAGHLRLQRRQGGRAHLPGMETFEL